MSDDPQNPASFELGPRSRVGKLDVEDVRSDAETFARVEGEVDEAGFRRIVHEAQGAAREPRWRTILWILFGLAALVGAAATVIALF